MNIDEILIKSMELGNVSEGVIEEAKKVTYNRFCIRYDSDDRKRIVYANDLNELIKAYRIIAGDNFGNNKNAEKLADKIIGLIPTKNRNINERIIVWPEYTLEDNNYYKSNMVNKKIIFVIDINPRRLDTETVNNNITKLKEKYDK